MGRGEKGLVSNGGEPPENEGGIRGGAGSRKCWSMFPERANLFQPTINSNTSARVRTRSPSNLFRATKHTSTKALRANLGEQKHVTADQARQKISKKCDNQKPIRGAPPPRRDCQTDFFSTFVVELAHLVCVHQMKGESPPTFPSVRHPLPDTAQPSRRLALANSLLLSSSPRVLSEEKNDPAGLSRFYDFCKKRLFSLAVGENA